MLKMGELLRYGDIDELVERDALFLRKDFRCPASPHGMSRSGNLLTVTFFELAGISTYTAGS